MGDNVAGEDTDEESEPDERDKHVSKDSEDELPMGDDGDYTSDEPDEDVTIRGVSTRFGALLSDHKDDDDDDDGEV
jgi:hypothetical protein